MNHLETEKTATMREALERIAKGECNAPGIAAQALAYTGVPSGFRTWEEYWSSPESYWGGF